MSTTTQGDEFPTWPALKAELVDKPDGTTAVTLNVPGDSQEFMAGSQNDARDQLINRVRHYLQNSLKHPGRLLVDDPETHWELGITLDPTEDPVILESKPRERPVPLQPVEDPPPPPPQMPSPPIVVAAKEQTLDLSSSEPEEPATVDPEPVADRAAATPIAKALDRRAIYQQRKGLFGRLNEMLSNPAERRERDVDDQLSRRWVVSDTNVIVVASSKGGVAKTANTIELGTCLASYLPNQRVAAIDFNVGGGALGSAAADDRIATHTMFELHRDRSRITRHSLLQPYVSSLPSGLDLLTVPPQPELALEITPQHYQELFDELLIGSYDILLLDTSPDLTNPVTRWALNRGTQLLIATEQGWMTGSVVQHALEYLLATPAAGGGKNAIAVINKVMTDSRAGSADETERALKAANHEMPVIRIPFDLNLRALIDGGHYDLEKVKERNTRLPIKEMALEVCRRLH